MASSAEVVLAVMNEVQGLAKKDRNQAQGFSFRGIDAVMNAVGPALRKAGGFIVPLVRSVRHESLTTAKGSQMNAAYVEVEFSVYGNEGEPVSGIVAAEAFDSGDKATAKAMSVAMRTFLLQLLCLPTDEPDPDSFSYEASKPARDWVAEADALALVYDLEGLRKLYKAAQAAKASPAILEKVKAYGNDLSRQTDSASGAS
jgi:hypothetical protein